MAALADQERSLSLASNAAALPSPSESLSAFSNIDLTESPSFASSSSHHALHMASMQTSDGAPLHGRSSLGTTTMGGILSSSNSHADEEAGLSLSLGGFRSAAPTQPLTLSAGKGGATAVNAEHLLAQARAIDDDIEELQLILMRVTAAVEAARSIADRTELESAAADVKQDLSSAVDLVKRSVKAQVARMQQDNAASLRVPGCGVGSSTFHMRQTVAAAVKNKLKRRRDNALDLESRLNMGIRDTAKRRYTDVMGSSPPDDLVDRLCSPAPPECKIGTLARHFEAPGPKDERMVLLLKEMAVRTAMAIDTSRKLGALERELTFLVDLLEHDESAMQYELSVERKHKRGFCLCVILALVLFFFVVFVVPGMALYL